MGMVISTLAMLLNEHKRRPFSGRVLQIGRQDIYFSYEDMEGCARALGVTLRRPAQIVHRPNEWMPNVKTIDDVTMFKALGFDEVQSIDASDYENPNYVHDFNLPIPESLHGQFDVVVDGGSLEHVFNVPMALANICSLLKVGGRAVHHAPTHNFVDHGFYQLSPTLFTDYYEANHFTDLEGYLLGCVLPYQQNAAHKIFKYTPGMLEPYSVGGITKESFQGCQMIITTFTATKTPASTGTVVPTQRRYREWWAKGSAPKSR
jgi:SAM-dependent methyltransferase